MYTLFNQPIVFNPALNKVTGWNETRRNVLEEMNRLAKFYHYTAQWSRAGYRCCRYQTGQQHKTRLPRFYQRPLMQRRRRRQ